MIELIYKKLNSKLSFKNRGRLSQIAYSFSSKPYYRKDNISADTKFPSSEKGGLVLSADFEMAWAFRYSKREVNPLEMAALERENVPNLLKLFETYSIPITWATVGHLFLESCKQGDHDWMRRIPHFDDHWKFTKGDWFEHDPYTNSVSNNAWYAPDLIESILKSKVKHEIGCHTFSHIDCSDKNCPPEVLEDELKASIEAAGKWGVKMSSFVFPGGTMGNYHILEKFDFNIYRKSIQQDLAYPYSDRYGMLVTASSATFCKGFDWKAEYYLLRFKRLIDKAIMTGTIAHIWMHPSVDKWTLNNVMPKVLQYAAEKRDKGLLWVGTMNQIANYIRMEKV